MNKKKAEKLKDTAFRSVLIIELIEQGLTINEITEKVGCQRQLVEYYWKVLKK